MNLEEQQFLENLKEKLGKTTNVSINSYSLTEMLKKEPWDVNSTLNPEEVFTVEQLDKWAVENGYVKFY